MMTEEWRWIKGYEDIYEVSSFGRVRHYKQGYPKTVSPSMCAGYECISLYYKKKSRRTRVHNLVAEAFIAEPQTGFQVHHIDGNKSNNRLDNIAYISSKEHHRITAEETNIGKRLGEWIRENNAKPIVAIDDDDHPLIIFESTVQAGTCIKGDVSVISKTARESRKPTPKRIHAYGYKWKYKDEVKDLCCQSNVWRKVQVGTVGFSTVTINTSYWTQELESRILKGVLVTT